MWPTEKQCSIVVNKTPTDVSAADVAVDRHAVGRAVELQLSLRMELKGEARHRTRPGPPGVHGKGVGDVCGEVDSVCGGRRGEAVGWHGNCTGGRKRVVTESQREAEFEDSTGQGFKSLHYYRTEYSTRRWQERLEEGGPALNPPATHRAMTQCPEKKRGKEQGQLRINEPFYSAWGVDVWVWLVIKKRLLYRLPPPTG